ncbi:uncharacterized protein UPF0233 [Microbacteriaceae bacterium MWH-Ta3]|nr:uncharacterized protein UPF0233 [Microbacteriaceae bacterium MWH-Ta3]
MVAQKSTPESGPVHTTEAPNAPWFKPVMFGFMLAGLLWIITYYVSQAQFPVAVLEQWNIAIGFGLMFTGFLMTTRWR